MSLAFTIELRSLSLNLARRETKPGFLFSQWQKFCRTYVVTVRHTQQPGHSNEKRKVLLSLD